jgi:hypothetical protein
MLIYYGMWEYVLGNVALLGLFSIHNSRAARKILIEEEVLVGEMIEKLMKDDVK